MLALGALVLGSTVARFALSRGVSAPWIASDEHLYGLLGRSLVAGDGLRVLGESVPHTVDMIFALCERSGPPLARLKEWMGRNTAVIMTVILLLIGVKLVGDAVSGFSA